MKSRLVMMSVVMLVIVGLVSSLHLIAGDSSGAAAPQPVSVVVYDERINLVGGLPEQVITLPPAGADISYIEIVGTLGGWSSIESAWAPAGQTMVVSPTWQARVQWGFFFPLPLREITWSRQENLLIADRAYTDPHVPMSVDFRQHNSTTLNGDLHAVHSEPWMAYLTGFAGTWGMGGGGYIGHGGDGWLDLQVIYWYEALPSFALAPSTRETGVLPSSMLTTAGEERPSRWYGFYASPDER